ncbi:NUDIX hydrolase [Mumia sp. zg.B17]|uniref:NUDIX hydrolase n=1 Tax=Mumia sp. zg.B17 TaxID=2855446 RepID=UPI001C6E25AE|nr:NUDIX hydrolase [Mumia sp. zg.B17]MBW9205694.1 NUDIX hydrolase [Mumia sp. zg.B17]
MADLTLRPVDAETFEVLEDGRALGTISLRLDDARTASLRWDLGPTEEPLRSQAVNLAITHAFDELGVTRVQTLTDEDAVPDRRAAARAGMRRDGLIRHVDGPDQELLSRLADDPQPQSREGFVAMLNAALPKKRAIAQALVCDPDGRVLLCELTYKREWDLPGGVVDPGESPADAVVRELREELGVEARIRGLRTVNWLPPWSAWDDAVLFVFDVEAWDPDAPLTLQPTEIAAVHWCDRDLLRERAAAATIDLLDNLDADPDGTYREAGHVFRPSPER